MRDFCSLGDNCELGLVQRRVGAEPLDLLRWTGSTTPLLLQLLADRFRAIGERDKLIVRTSSDQYFTHHTGYDFRWHAFVTVGQMTPEQLLRRERARLPRMAEIMIETLTEGRRIFVIKRAEGLGISQAEAEDVLAAINTYGPGRLMFVTLADDRQPSGSVERVGPRLLHGYIDQFADVSTMQLKTPVESWLAVCRAAKRALLEQTETAAA